MFILGSPSALAVEISGVGKAEYSWGVDKNELRAAELDALRKAVEKWISTVHPQHFKNYKSVKDEVEKNIQDYILESSIVNQVENGDTKMLEVKVRAMLNEPMLMDTLLSLSEQKVGGDYIAIVFVAREHAGTVMGTDKEASQTKSQTKTIGKDTEGDSASITKTKLETTGVKTREVKAAESTLWRAFTTNEINTAMGSVFTSAEYLVVDADLLEEETGGLLDIESFVRDYAGGDDVAPATRSDAIKGLKNLEDPVRYLAIGTLDVDQTVIDEMTGHPSVTVSATGQVLDITKRGAAVAKVGPTLYTATGRTHFEATNNALQLAGQEVATEIVARLSSRSIR
jgi:hypothetical protein